MILIKKILTGFSLLIISSHTIGSPLKLDINHTSKNEKIVIGVQTNKYDIFNNIKNNYKIYKDIKVNYGCNKNPDYCAVFNRINTENGRITKLTLRDGYGNVIASDVINKNIDDGNINSFLSSIYSGIYNQDSIYRNKISYVESNYQKLDKSPNVFNLVVSDFNGFNKKILLKSPLPITSINISNDNNGIVYTTFEKVRPSIVYQNIKTGKRDFIANFKGINSMPKFNRSNDKIIMALSKESTSDIYVYSIADKKTTMITNDNSDNISPIFLDNDNILYISSKDGIHRIIKKNLITNKVIKIKSKINYISSLTLKDSNHIVAVIKDKIGYSIAEINIINGSYRIIKRDAYAESPSISSDMKILYSTKDFDKNIIKLIDFNGDELITIRSGYKNLKSPIISNGDVKWVSTN